MKTKKTRPVVPIGDSVIKQIDPKKLSQRHIHKFSFPGKTTGGIAEAVDSIAVASDPSHVIIHTGTNNLPTESAQSSVGEIKSLVLVEHWSLRYSLQRRYQRRF